MERFFLGFGDELVKLSSELSGAGELVGAAEETLGELGAAMPKSRAAVAGLGTAGGGIGGAILGALMGGKGRRGKGAAVGTLLGALLGGAKGATMPERYKYMGKRLREAAEKKASDKAVQEELHRRLKAGTGEGALTLGGLAAAIAALSGRKGRRLKRALAGGAAGGVAGGLVGLHGRSAEGLNVHRMADLARDIKKIE